MPKLAGSVDELLAVAERREPFVNPDGRSSSAFERAWIDGVPHIVKYVHLDHDFTMRVSGDVGPRTARAWAAGLLDSGKHVSVTGKRQDGYAEVIVGRLTTRWVTDDYLSKSKVRPPGSLGLVDKSCPGTSGVESGLTSGAVRVYRAVCNNFPQITQYGGYDAHGEHASGRAIDIG